jgi:hypothetical protein
MSLHMFSLSEAMANLNVEAVEKPRIAKEFFNVERLLFKNATGRFVSRLCNNAGW